MTSAEIAPRRFTASSARWHAVTRRRNVRGPRRAASRRPAVESLASPPRRGRGMEGPIMQLLVSLALATGVAAGAGLARPLLAHHSFAAEYDDQKPLKISGTLA